MPGNRPDCRSAWENGTPCETFLAVSRALRPFCGLLRIPGSSSSACAAPYPLESSIASADEKRAVSMPVKTLRAGGKRSARPRRKSAPLPVLAARIPPAARAAHARISARATRPAARPT